jgi:hypothetical protein
MPVQKLSTKYFREAFLDEKIQLVIPHERVDFTKIENGEVVNTKSKCPFDCYYYFYDCGLPNKATWL